MLLLTTSASTCLPHSRNRILQVLLNGYAYNDSPLPPFKEPIFYRSRLVKLCTFWIKVALVLFLLTETAPIGTLIKEYKTSSNSPRSTLGSAYNFIGYTVFFGCTIFWLGPKWAFCK